MGRLAADRMKAPSTFMTVVRADGTDGGNGLRLRYWNATAVPMSSGACSSGNGMFCHVAARPGPRRDPTQNGVGDRFDVVPGDG
jgi:hypothetical protein